MDSLPQLSMESLTQLSMEYLPRLPTFLLGLILSYGAFSRLTHGSYTPRFYKYQTSRQPDDGSVAARLPIVMDLVLAPYLMFGSPAHRSVASIVFAAAQTFGIFKALNSGLDWTLDGAMLVLGVLGVIL